MNITIAGLPPFDGKYELEPPFNAAEWRVIKQTSGALPTTLVDALKGGDPDVTVALVMIALGRKGQLVDEKQILSNYYPGSEVGARIELEFPEEKDAVPPPSPPSEPEQRRSSGISGSVDGDTRPASDPSSTGPQPSENGSDSAPMILGV